MHARTHLLVWILLWASLLICRSQPTSAFWLYNRKQQEQQKPHHANHVNREKNDISDERHRMSLRMVAGAGRGQQPQQQASEHHQVVVTTAPVELQFEINAEEPADYVGKVSSGPEARPSGNPHVANGSAILEDLVNQFLARSREQQQAERADDEREHEFSATISLLKGANSTGGGPASSKQQQQLLEPAAGEANSLTSPDEIEDKHIPYDVVGNVSQEPLLLANMSGGRSSNMRASTELPPLALNGNNFTLSPVRVGPHKDSAPQGQLAKGSAAKSSGAVELTSGKSNSSTSTDYNSIQARAMSSPRASLKPNGSNSGAQQHPKPPYASSYHQMDSDGLRLQQRMEHGGDDAPPVATQDATREDGGTKGEHGQEAARVALGGAKYSEQQSATIAQPAASSTPKPLEDREQQLASRERDELERVAARYAPTNEIAEINLIPLESSTLLANNHRKHTGAQTSSAAADTSGEQSLLSERFFVPAAPSSQQAPRDQHLDKDRYAQPPAFDLNAVPFGDNQDLQDYEPPGSQVFGPTAGTQLPPSSSSGTTTTTMRPHNFSSAAPDSKHLAHSLSSQALNQLVNRKTLETLSNQIQSSDSSFLSHSQPLHQHQSRSPPDIHLQQQRLATGISGNSNNHHRLFAARPSPDGAPYVASLINVTAPMVSPLSASEAMEAERHDLMAHHKSFRPNTYFLPPPVADSRPLYSRPANTFSGVTQEAPQRPLASHQQLPGGGGGGDQVERVRLGESMQHLVPVASGFQVPASRTQLAHWVQNHGTSLAMPSSYLDAIATAAANEAANSTASSSMQKPEQQVANAATTGGAATSGSAPKNVSQSFATGGSGASSGLQSTTQQMTTTVPTTTSTSPSSSITSSTTTVATTNGFVTSMSNPLNTNGSTSTNLLDPSASAAAASQMHQQHHQQQSSAINRRMFNLTRVEHISAECSNDLIRTVIIFNGTFRGLIYSSGYVQEPNCLYINGTGKSRYDFSIRLNECGTTGRQELHSASGPNEIKRRDQVMWNALSIQYNPAIEQEWDEHFRVSCEYGSDFWKTISFNPFNVETNTGSPVVFTVDPPQCQMEILRGHGTVGPRQEALSSPVTVGDPLTLLVHMRSEKAGYDIIIKNCIAHNGGKQKMQLIDANGCVVNERFISPFRGMYNDKDLKHITLYAYMKAFRFTGSSALYVECEVHMCQTACPPQMCYWRSLS